MLFKQTCHLNLPYLLFSQENDMEYEQLRHDLKQKC